MSTPNDIITLSDYFAAAALAGIVAKRMDINNANTVFDSSKSTSEREQALEDLREQAANDLKLAYLYAEAAIAHRTTAAMAEAA